MIGLVRATVICATLALGLTAAGAADKAFKRDELADSAIKLEAQIKSEAGAVAKSNATLKTDADAAFKRLDFRTGLQVLGQIAGGNRNRDIAERLFITEETVKVHIKHIMEKLGASDRTQAVAIGIRRGIIQL